VQKREVPPDDDEEEEEEEEERRCRAIFVGRLGARVTTSVITFRHDEPAWFDACLAYGFSAAPRS
jgi:hypothetical protein